ncbi:MAG: hypothetical protein EOP05_22355 [Proteobacteria bacterium]|nr:MAG: hypothetical protein EOP05_22355 [Pseudomonadota bacterium]
MSGRKAQRLYQALETLAQAKVAGVEEMVTNSNEGTEQDPDAYDQVTSLEIAGKIICIESASMSLKMKTADRYTCKVSK